jgi:poly(3-hydroxybutyrate) depolymerase
MIGALAGLALAARAAAAPPLGAYDVKLDETSVSGVSSGAYMAVQLAVARSALVVGAGAIAGGPYGCAGGSASTALGACMLGPPPPVAALRDAAARDAAAGRIDPLAGVARQKLWLFHGSNDGVVRKPVSDALAAFWAAAGAPPGNVQFRDDLPAAHAHVGDGYGQACGRTGGAFMNRCDGVDAAGAILQLAYGKLRERRAPGALTGRLLPFSQAEFHPDVRSISMAETGYVYVPASCAAGERCRAHVAFHGCLQGADAIGTAYVEHAGYAEWADANGIVVLYPQAVATSRVPVPGRPYNPNGCWDWWGYAGRDYARRDGPQIATVLRMLERLAGRYGGWAGPAANAAAAPALAAIDVSSTTVALAWTAAPGVVRTALERADDAACARWAEVPGATAHGPSFADRGLAPRTRHCWRLRVERAGGAVETTPVVVATTAAAPAACDPYVRTVAQHWREGRTHLRWLKTYANGSDEYAGDTGPSSLFEQVLLVQTRPGYFTVGKPCP